MVACGDLYETHEKYLKMGEETYVGRADSLQANGGFNRVELKWKLNVDPKISKCVITWNGCQQPVEVAVDRPGSWMSKIIDITENKYIFKIVVMSDSGKESLVQTVSGESYGTEYQSRLPQKGISSILATPAGTTISWLQEEGCVGVNLSYTNKEGTKKTVFVEGNATSTLIDDFVPGSEFTMSSLFKPETNAIDNIASLPKTLSFPSYYTISKADWDQTYHKDYTDVSHTGWTLDVTTEEQGGEGAVSGYATALLDGNLSTYWHSAWRTGPGGVINPPLPHLITLDMQVSQDIISVELARRANNKDTKTVAFSISDDKVNWKELGVLNFPNATTPNAMILLLPNNVKGKYIRAAVTGSNNGANASIAEIMFTKK
ncbi:chitobiase [Bacteroidia bacterium]|nr:chitobiase [Bacteroidia bacterium]